MFRSRGLVLVSLMLSLALVACKEKEPRSAAVGTTDTLTERERNDMLSTSGIPGASGVGAAMRAADATSGGIRAAESVAP